MYYELANIRQYKDNKGQPYFQGHKGFHPKEDVYYRHQ